MRADGVIAMAGRAAVPWERIYDYTMACGSRHDPLEFVVAALEEARDLVPYDQGLVFLLDERRRVRGQHLVNIESHWSTMYLGYYSHLESTERTLDADVDEMRGTPLVVQLAWSEEPKTEFVLNYIMERGVKCSLGFALFDLNGLPRAAFSLDRTRAERFTDAEVEAMRFAVAQLGNLFKNFFTTTPGRVAMEREHDVIAISSLTKREREIVDLLCQGLSPSQVAKTLRISPQTAYKHVSHIHKKLNVSNQQELLVLVLGK